MQQLQINQIQPRGSRFTKHKWLERSTCINDIKPLCEKLNIKVLDSNPAFSSPREARTYKVCRFELQNGKFTPVFSEFRIDKQPTVRDLVSAVTAALKTKAGQSSFCQGYLLQNMNKLYDAVGLMGRHLSPDIDHMKEIGRRMANTTVTYNSLIPLQGITRPTASGFHIWLRVWGVLGHELMHASSNLDHFPGNGLLGKIKTVVQRLIGYFEGPVMAKVNAVKRKLFGYPAENAETTLFRRYYGSRLWALNRHNHSAVLEETFTSALDDENDKDFEGLWGSVKISLLSLPINARKSMMDRLMRTWMNFTGDAENAACEKFVIRAIRTRGEAQGKG